MNPATNPEIKRKKHRDLIPQGVWHDLHQRSWHDDEYDKNLKHWKSKHKLAEETGLGGLTDWIIDRPTGNEPTDFDLLQRNNANYIENTYTEYEDISEDGPYSTLFGMTDEDILAKLPKSRDDTGNARALTKCIYGDGCQRVASYKGLCTEHICELYRSGELDIPEPSAKPAKVTPDLRRSSPRKHDKERSRAAPTNGHENPREERKERRECAAPMCTKYPSAGEFCERCAVKFTNSASPDVRHKTTARKSKWQCTNSACNRQANTKHGLCERCSAILMDVNARKIPMPKPEVVSPKRRTKESTKPRHRETENRHEHEYTHARENTRRDERRRAPNAYEEQPWYAGEILPEPERQRTTKPSARARPKPDQHTHEERQPRHRSPLNFDPNPSRYREPLEPAYRGFEIVESSPPPSLISDTTTTSASDDDYSLCSYVSNAKPMKCKATGCGNFGNKACAGFCNSCYSRFA